jgi:hypothetical protein
MTWEWGFVIVLILLLVCSRREGLSIAESESSLFVAAPDMWTKIPDVPNVVKQHVTGSPAELMRKCNEMPEAECVAINYDQGGGDLFGFAKGTELPQDGPEVVAHYGGSTYQKCAIM